MLKDGVPPADGSEGKQTGRETMSIVNLRRAAALIMTFFALAAVGSASSAPLARVDNPHTDLEVFAHADGLAAGEPVRLALRFTPTPGWHTYWVNYGDSGKPPNFRWTLPDGWEVARPLYPVPERIPVGPLMNYGYERPASLIVEMTPPADYAGGSVPVALEAHWLVCEEICIPERGELFFTLDPEQVGREPAARKVLLEAEAALPSQAPWPVSAAMDDEDFRLSVELPAQEAKLVETAYFFPHQEGVLDYAVEQRLNRTASGLSLTVPRPGYPMDAERVSGVLVIENAAGREEGFRLSASLAKSAALAAATGGAGLLGFDGGAGGGALSMSLFTAVIFALLGGMFLNLMPCVFPVLSLKAFSLIKAHGAGEAAARRDGLAYTAGILASFGLVGGALIALRGAGAEIGWGFQLQSPAIITGLALLLFVVGLNLTGLFELPSRLSGLGQGLTERSGLSGAFFTGVLATVVATPCTAPLMAPALGFAIFQPAPVAIAIFLSLGLGLALPYLLVSMSPAVRRLLPRPGPWMLRLRQFLAFPMFLTATWLVWVLALQAGANAVALALTLMVAIGFFIWLWGMAAGGGRRLRSVAAVMTIVLLGGLFQFGQGAIRTTGSAGKASQDQADASLAERMGVEPWSPSRLADLRAEGRPVFVYFTAAWCITCKVNERVAMDDAEVISHIRENDIAVLEADWTNHNETIARELARFGRSGVPLYLFYPAGGEEAVLLPQVLTPSNMIEAFEQAERTSVARS